MSTYTPQAAIDLVKNFVHGVPLDNVDSQVCDMVNMMIWRLYPWSWSIKSLTPINCVDGTQDYTPTDTDILRPLKFRLALTSNNPTEYRELALMANISPDLTWKLGLETERMVGWFANGPTIRLMTAVSLGSGQTMQIQGEYQKYPTRITDATMTTAFAQPDYYFDVFVEGLKWKLYQLSDDPHAGGVEYSKNGNVLKRYTGQYGIFLERLFDMARTEDLSSGDEFQFPDAAFGALHQYWPGIMGF